MKRAIALFLNQVHGYFQASILRIVREFAQGADLDLFVLAGLSLRGDPSSARVNNPALDLVASPRIAGILLAGTIIEVEERESIANFLRELGKPVFSISNRMPGLPCVLSDSRTGIIGAVEHLARDHGRKRIAYLGGPDWSYESDDRLQAYREGLRSIGVEPDPSLEFAGTFVHQSGRNLAEARARGDVPPFDALISANDAMAIGFQAAGEALGIDVPRDVALCGFDDDPEALVLPKPLSTVRQPFARLYRVAGEALLRQMAGGPPSIENIYVPTEFVVRESCGCAVSRIIPAAEGRGLTMKGLKPATEGRAAERGGFSVEVSPERPLAYGNDAARLLGALMAEARGEAVAGSFRAEVEFVLETRKLAGIDLADLPSTLAGLLQAATAKEPDSGWLERARIPLLEGNLMMAKAIGDQHIRDIRYLRDAISLVNTFSQDIGKARNEEPGTPTDRGTPLLARAIADKLDRVLPEARIGYCALSLFPEGGSGTAPEESVLYYSIGARNEGRGLPLPFRTADILPDSALPRGSEHFSCIALPLVDSDLIFGFLFFRDEGLGQDYSLPEIFRSQVSNALGRARIAAELFEKETRERVETEKLAAMGTLVAGVAHEINTPIGVCVTAASHVSALVARLRESHRGGGLTRGELADFLGDASETASILSANLDRAAALVSSFKKVAVDASSEERRFFRLKEYMGDILAALSPRLKRTRLRFEIDCPEDLEIDSYPGAFSQVFTNLIVNSISHGYAEPAEGVIRIETSLADGLLTWVYRDDGRGIPPEIAGKIFDPYFTTRRDSGGSGLGLYIVYNIVAGVFKGRISVGAAPGGGAQFTLTIPIGEGEYRYAGRL